MTTPVFLFQCPTCGYTLCDIRDVTHYCDCYKRKEPTAEVLAAYELIRKHTTPTPMIKAETPRKK